MDIWIQLCIKGNRSQLIKIIDNKDSCVTVANKGTIFNGSILYGVDSSVGCSFLTHITAKS